MEHGILWMNWQRHNYDFKRSWLCLRLNTSAVIAMCTHFLTAEMQCLILLARTATALYATFPPICVRRGRMDERLTVWRRIRAPWNHIGTPCAIKK